MTGTCRFKARFKDLVAMVKLSYHGMKQGKLVVDLPVLGTNEVFGFRYQEISAYGPQGGLRKLQKLIFDILRCTMVPSVGGDDNAVGWPFFEIINVVLSGELINWLDWLVHQMLECKRNVNAPLILQPYIKALVFCTIKDFRATCEVSHQVHWPLIDNEAYLARESSPMACRILGPNSLG